MNLSVIIIVKNEDAYIEDCLKSVKDIADEIILLDGGSTDKTLVIAQKYPVKIIKQNTIGLDYAAWHNQGKQEAKGDWLLYLDADERLTPELAKEIAKVYDRKSNDYSVYALPRRNILLGKELHYGGWYPDYQTRLFQKSNLVKWIGKLHEHPEYTGNLGYLKSAMIHLQPETLEPAFEKTIKWSSIEADLLFKANHPLITWWRVLRMGVTTLFERLIKKQGFRDGKEGIIESFYQAIHTMIVYLRLWEKQK